MDLKIKMPEKRKASVMLWTDVNYRDMEEIDSMQSIPDLESALCSVFKIDLPPPKRAGLLDLYVQTVLFCRECNFNREQTSATLSILKSVHEINIETPLNNLEQCFKYFKEILLCHSVRRPPFSIDLFNSQEVNCIFKYIHNSYIRHYKLYKYIFTSQVKLDLSLTYSEIPELEDSAVPEEAQVLPKHGESTETQETSITEQEETLLDSASQLKTLIEKQVKDQMMLVSGRLDQRMNEIAEQHIGVLDSNNGTEKR